MSSDGNPAGLWVHSLAYLNETDVPLAVWVEPWAMECVIPPGSVARFESEAEQPVPDEPELEVEAGRLVFWGAGGTIMRFYLDDLLTTAFEVRVPLTDGFSMKQLIKMLFGTGNSDGA